MKGIPAPRRDIALQFDAKKVERDARAEGTVWGLPFAKGTALQGAWDNMINPEYSGGFWLYFGSVREVTDRCIHATTPILTLRIGNAELRTAWFRGFGAGAAAVLATVLDDGKHERLSDSRAMPPPPVVPPLGQTESTLGKEVGEDWIR